ncbi:D-amino acid dehydrogenase [Duganella sp. FT80W]|uniref:D-amino acid dehydrogenase n=1 Tax=Duganella guangzhouensis TaxID=2666084 RepID=A0A6I2KYA3_9BURK|nr:D-amino acid dehydrogenase [Duganella guangzhouensis]MRW90542.1 D-amino acid dehydrogenase [Duganella guangzhouensis]
MKNIAIIGGGVTGVTTAYALAKRGFAVTLLERHRYTAMETSYANGGQLSASNAEVWNHRATVAKALQWLLRSDAPLLVHLHPTWHKLSWFAEFIGAMPQYHDNTIALARMAVAAREHLFRWAEDEGIAFDLRRQGILHLHRDRAEFEHAAAVTKLLARAGVPRRAVTPDEMLAIEPTLRGQYYGGHYTDSDSSGDIHKFVTGLAQAAQRLGAQLRCNQQVVQLNAVGGGIDVTVLQDDSADTSRYDAVVVCAGAGSRDFAAQLGDDVNVYPVKGYSVTVHLDDEASRAAAPQVSLVDDTVKLVCSRLGEDRLRVAGTAEFHGYNRDIRADRIAPLTEWVQHNFPEVSTRAITPWAGLRPMMPDLLPRVGPGKAPGVFYNTGHGHLGWTLSATTADTIANAISAARDSSRTQAALPLKLA